MIPKKTKERKEGYFQYPSGAGRRGFPKISCYIAADVDRAAHL